ncbi:MAG: hypothetical protein KIT84_26085 [Labilithrix sp.]|nr:hypothetical protein [Labilithrix sp.]MCW5814525.1 hypothetical protein [Labilithrix sp.]
MRRLLVLLVVAACRETAPAPTPDAGVPAPSARREAGAIADALPLDPACDGPSLSLLEAARDRRCAVGDAEWNALREAPGLAQEARRDGAHVVFSIVNRGTAPVLVPIRFDDRAPERVFTAVAQVEGDAAGLFALPPPAPELRASDAGVYVYTARIRLPPGGRASVRLAIQLRAVERLDRRGDGGLALEGPVILHLGQAFSPVSAGDPAQVRWGAVR